MAQFSILIARGMCYSLRLIQRRGPKRPKGKGSPGAEFNTKAHTGAERGSAFEFARKPLKNQGPRPLIWLRGIWFSLRLGLDFVASDLAFVAPDLDSIRRRST